jgi:hypothetical protein
VIASLMQDIRYALRQSRRSPGFALTAIAVPALGLGSNIAVSLARSHIFGVQAHDGLTFGMVVAVLAAASFPAAWMPARHAASIEPIVALRSK